MSYIRLTRDELIWETRQYTFDENDWSDFLKREEESLQSDGIRHYNAEQILAAVKALSFEDIVADFQHWDRGEECIIVMQKHGWRNEPLATPLADIIRDEIREYVYEADVIDTNCTDRYEEEFEFDMDKVQERDNA